MARYGDLLKRGSPGAANAGLEPYSEYYASQIIGEFTNEYVAYDLRTVSGKICSVCDIFTSESLGYLPFVSVAPGNSTIKTVLNKAKEYGLESRFRRMFVIDAVIMNEDRHKSYNLPEWRLDALEKLIRQNIQKILQYRI